MVQLTIINEVVSYECQCEYGESEELEVFTNRDLFHPLTLVVLLSALTDQVNLP